MVSVEGLSKLVDPSQLTDDFEGSLDYNHEEWMDLRVSLEEFMSSAVHLLSRLEDLQVRKPTEGEAERPDGDVCSSLNGLLLCLPGASVQKGISCRCGRVSTADRRTHPAEKEGEEEGRQNSGLKISVLSIFKTDLRKVSTSE